MPVTSRRPHEVLADRIAETAAHASITKHSLLKLIAEFDAMDGWSRQGAMSCAHWLSWRIGLAPGAAREQVRVALALRELPKIDAAFACGELSYSKVRALTRVATAENEDDLINVAKSTTAAQLERICSKFRGVIDEAQRPTDPKDTDERRFVRVHYTEDGMMQIDIRLLPDEGARLLAAIDAGRAIASDQAQAERQTPHASSEKVRRNRADGVMVVAETFAASDVTTRTDARCEVIVHVDAAALAGKTEGGFIDSAGGTGVSAESVRRLACDCARVPVVEDERGQVLDIGRRTRTIPSAIRRALRVRDDETCQFPGCTRRRFLDAHHIHHWADGGETKLDNLVLLCGRHHRFVHEHGFTIESDADGLSFVPPDARALRATPPLETYPPSVVEDLVIRHREEGHDVHPYTPTPPYYDGERMDLHWVVAALSTPYS